MTTLFTSESVTEGHPDKVADSVSDAVLDALLEQNPATRAAIETLCSTGLVVVAGEVDAGESWVDVDKIARQRIVDVGYNSSEVYFDGNSCGVLVALHAQSPDIAGGVLASEEARAGSVDIKDQLGAGDQGMMFGYACRETSTLMPLPIDISHRLAEQLTAVRKGGDVDFLRPDGKTQVSVRYDGDKAVGIDTIVVSTQHDAQVTQEHIAAEVRRRVIDPVLERFGWGLDESSKILINPSGRFEIGGPHGDTGLTGRKLIVDTYGGVGRHGGGAFSGKDPSKVDRSGAYAMRWVAKNVVAAGLAERCEVQVAYAIGKAHPVSLSVTTFGTGSVPDADITRAIGEVFDLRPRSIIEDLDLIRPIYGLTSCYGHFGRELPEFTWERTDRAEALARAVRG